MNDMFGIERRDRTSLQDAFHLGADDPGLKSGAVIGDAFSIGFGCSWPSLRSIAAFVVVIVCALTATSERKPNIVFVLTEDLGRSELPGDNNTSTRKSDAEGITRKSPGLQSGARISIATAS